MPQEWTESTTVHAGGKVELILPSLTAGERVTVTVRKETPSLQDGLRNLAGTLSDVDADEMRQAIENEFETIDPNEWK